MINVLRVVEIKPMRNMLPNTQPLSFYYLIQAITDKARLAKETVLFFTPDIIKDNLAFVLSIFGDSTMTVPLEAAIFSTAIQKLFYCDDDIDSDGFVSELDIYLFSFLAMALLCYPGQSLIAYKKNKDSDDEEEGCHAVKKIARGVSIFFVSVSTGLSGYLLFDKLSSGNQPASIAYGIFTVSLNGVFRQIFFNSSDNYNPPVEFKSSLTKHAAKASASSLSLVYALSSSTPFAAARISKCSSDLECVVLLAMVGTMSAGEYLRMNSGLLNYLHLLENSKVEFNVAQKAICGASAAMRTALTMGSVDAFPKAAQIVSLATLTPGVAFFQFSACMPPSEFKTGHCNEYFDGTEMDEFLAEDYVEDEITECNSQMV